MVSIQVASSEPNSQSLSVQVVRGRFLGYTLPSSPCQDTQLSRKNDLAAAALRSRAGRQPDSDRT
jgi:hypothetical protein